MVICPKNADSLNMSLVREGSFIYTKNTSTVKSLDVLYHLPGLDEPSINALISFAIAGAGFDNMGTVLAKWSTDEISRLAIYFKKWKNSRTYLEFFDMLFNQYGYECDDVS